MEPIVRLNNGKFSKGNCLLTYKKYNDDSKMYKIHKMYEECDEFFYSNNILITDEGDRRIKIYLENNDMQNLPGNIGDYCKYLKISKLLYNKILNKIHSFKNKIETIEREHKYDYAEIGDYQLKTNDTKLVRYFKTKPKHMIRKYAMLKLGNSLYIGKIKNIKYVEYPVEDCEFNYSNIIQRYFDFDEVICFDKGASCEITLFGKIEQNRNLTGNLVCEISEDDYQYFKNEILEIGKKNVCYYIGYRK